MSKVIVIQHIEHETPGMIAEALTEEKIDVVTHRAFERPDVPLDIGEASGLVIMGGPMGVYEHQRFPFLHRELKLIEATLKAGKPVLGICLGSQLLATVLGAKVGPGERWELGWHPVSLTDAAKADPLFSGAPDSFTALHWHGDIFDPPREAVVLALSQLTPVQAYCYNNNAYGILFHMEITEPMIREWVRSSSGDIAAAGQDGGAILAGIQDHMASLSALARRTFSNWVRMLPRDK